MINVDTSVEKELFFKRSEIISKYNVSNEINEEIKGNELEEIIKKIESINEEIAKKEPVKVKVKVATFDDKRSEIVGKFNVENKKMDKLLEKENKKVEEGNFDEIKKHFSLKRSEIVTKYNCLKEVSNEISDNQLNNIVNIVVEKSKNFKKLVPVDVKIADLVDRRSEIVDKFVSKSVNEIAVAHNESTDQLNEVKVEKLNDEELEDKVQENVENISIAVIAIIVLVCAILGTIIGYMLYRIAMGNSVAMALIIKNIVFGLHI